MDLNQRRIYHFVRTQYTLVNFQPYSRAKVSKIFSNMNSHTSSHKLFGQCYTELNFPVITGIDISLFIHVQVILTQPMLNFMSLFIVIGHDHLFPVFLLPSTISCINVCDQQLYQRGWANMCSLKSQEALVYHLILSCYWHWSHLGQGCVCKVMQFTLM